jgi:hypothetical protein
VYHVSEHYQPEHPGFESDNYSLSSCGSNGGTALEIAKMMVKSDGDEGVVQARAPEVHWRCI